MLLNKTTTRKLHTLSQLNIIYRSFITKAGHKVQDLCVSTACIFGRDKLLPKKETRRRKNFLCKRTKRYKYNNHQGSVGHPVFYKCVNYQTTHKFCVQMPSSRSIERVLALTPGAIGSGSQFRKLLADLRHFLYQYYRKNYIIQIYWSKIIICLVYLSAIFLSTKIFSLFSVTKTRKMI